MKSRTAWGREFRDRQHEVKAREPVAERQREVAHEVSIAVLGMAERDYIVDVDPNTHTRYLELGVAPRIAVETPKGPQYEINATPRGERRDGGLLDLAEHPVNTAALDQVTDAVIYQRLQQQRVELPEQASVGTGAQKHELRVAIAVEIPQ
jgi:hypothetical protein